MFPADLPAFLIVLPSYQWQSAEPWFWLNQPGIGSDDEAPEEGPGKNKPGGSSSLAPTAFASATVPFPYLLCAYIFQQVYSYVVFLLHIFKNLVLRKKKEKKPFPVIFKPELVLSFCEDFFPSFCLSVFVSRSKTHSAVRHHLSLPHYSISEVSGRLKVLLSNTFGHAHALHLFYQ